MGLDIVEIVIEVEEAFDIRIPDDRAGQMTTVGDLYDLMIESKRGSLAAQDDPAAAWEALKQIIVYQLGVKPEAVTVDARFVDDFGAD